MSNDALDTLHTLAWLRSRCQALHHRLQRAGAKNGTFEVTVLPSGEDGVCVTAYVEATVGHPEPYLLALDAYAHTDRCEVVATLQLDEKTLLERQATVPDFANARPILEQAVGAFDSFVDDIINATSTPDAQPDQAANVTDSA